jgi:hypothetical protein
MGNGKVHIRGRAPITAKAGAKAVGGPDVCLTPTPGGPSVPIPYPNTAQSTTLKNGSQRTFVGGHSIMLADSELASSAGDEAGTGGNLLSAKTGGAATAIGTNARVLVEGRPVVCNQDVALLNNQGAMGFFQAPEGAAAPAVGVKRRRDPDPVPCDVCGEEDHTTPAAKKRGFNNRSEKDLPSQPPEEPQPKDNGKHNVRRFLAANGWKKIEKHPWYTTGGSLQVHHLICIDHLRNAQWYQPCKSFGYTPNDAHNNIALPAVAKVACALRAPLHLGNHNHGYCYDEHGQRIDKNTGRATTDDKKSLIYTEAVRNHLEVINKDVLEGNYCREGEPTGKAFVEDMSALSRLILKKLDKFTWTLRADGRLYAPYGKGCGETDGADSCREHPLATLKHTKNSGEAGQRINLKIRITDFEPFRSTLS